MGEEERERSTRRGVRAQDKQLKTGERLPSSFFTCSILLSRVSCRISSSGIRFNPAGSINPVTSQIHSSRKRRKIEPKERKKIN